MKRGQSIIEAMIALSILTVGFLGISSLLVRSFFLSRVTSDELTATYLASEGVEITKNILDHDVYAVPPYAWGTCAGTCSADGAYTVEYDSQTPTPTAALTCSLLSPSTPPLHLDPATGLYGYTSGPATKFSRCIQITHNSNSSGDIVEVTVNSIVTWSSGAITNQSVNLEDHFYDWQP